MKSIEERRRLREQITESLGIPILLTASKLDSIIARHDQTQKHVKDIDRAIRIVTHKSKGLTSQQIGKIENISASRVSNIWRQAIAMANGMLKKQGMKFHFSSMVGDDKYELQVHLN